MPFFWHIKILEKYISKNYKTNKPSLRERNPEFLTLEKYIYLITYLKKRVSSFISQNTLKASMTLEAALVLPCFLFAMLSLVSVIDMIKIKGCMDVAVVEAGNEIAIESYLEDSNELLTSLFIKQKITSFLNENLSERELAKIEGNICITNSSIIEEDGIISFRVDYKLRPIFHIDVLNTVNISATYYGHKWTGYEEKEESETMVFISDSAYVYHTDKSCKYLNVTIMEIPFGNLEKYRNNSGEKYKECNFCNEFAVDKIVYITPEGSNYHTVKNCIGLSRSIHTVPLSMVSGKRVCSGCGE